MLWGAWYSYNNYSREHNKNSNITFDYNIIIYNYISLETLLINLVINH